MKHKFDPSYSDKTKCGVVTVNKLCGHSEIDHTDMAECDYCEYVGVVEVTLDNSVSCPQCFNEANVPPPIAINEVLKQARLVDNLVEVRTDLFNSETISIMKLKEVIDADPTITNKPYTLANELITRFNRYKTVMFELNEKQVETSNKQKAIQIYLNQLANSLRTEEREKLKIHDINYRIRAAKEPIKIKTIKASSKKLDKVELRKFAKELGVGEFTLQMIVIQKNLTIAQAAAQIRQSIATAKSLTSNEGN